MSAKRGLNNAYLLPYAGLMTLLFALFAALYALSLKDSLKAKSAVQGIKKSFSLGQGGSGRGATDPFAPGNKSGTGETELAQVQRIIGDLPGESQIFEDRRGIIVRIAAQDFFGPGEAHAGDDFLPLLNRIGRVVAKSARAVKIEGHSDPAEMGLKTYPSDWELSASRAAWVARLWIASFGLDPARIQITGFSHHRPLDEGSTEWAQGKNRRVEIVLTRDP